MADESRQSGESSVVPTHHKRTGFSNRPPKPATHIHKLITRMQDYLYLPVADPVYIMLGSVIGNMLKGAPVWLVFIGPPSTGKTVKLESLDALKPPRDRQTQRYTGPGVHIVGGITGPAALLSGVSKRESSKGATGGLLREIGDRGVLVMKDFSTMLALGRDQMGAAIDGLRQTFDGRYDRPLGTDGGVRIEWKGRIGFIAASTPALDTHQKDIAELGERWMYYRYNASDGFGETIKALGVSDPGRMMDEMRMLISHYFERIEVGWDEGRRELTGQETYRLYAMAALVTTARSTVPRDPYKHMEISEIPSREGPARLATQLGQLYLGLERGGLEAEECWRLVGRVALDSVKQSRMRVLEVVKQDGVAGTTQVRAQTPLGKHTVEQMMEDLQVHGVLEWCEGVTNSKGEVVKAGYRLSKWAKEQWEIGWGKGNVNGHA